ncbi:MAG: cell division protein FtsB [Thioalkalispiraceae bacterium]
MKILVAASFLSLLAILQYDLWFGDGSLMAAWKLEDQITEQKQVNEQLQHRNDALAAEVSDLKSGLAAIEERARSELGMIKEGETFVQVLDQDKTSKKESH